MKCMYAQTRPRFILSSEGVLGGMEFEPMLTPREKSPLPKMSPVEDRTRDAVDSEPKHYQLSYSGPEPEFEHPLDIEESRVSLYIALCYDPTGACEQNRVILQVKVSCLHFLQRIILIIFISITVLLLCSCVYKSVHVCVCS